MNIFNILAKKFSYMNTVHLDQYRMSFLNDELFFFDDKNDQIVFRISNVTPTHEELVARECSSVEDFFKVELGPMIQNELELNDLQLQEIKSNLIQMGYFK